MHGEDDWDDGVIDERGRPDVYDAITNLEKGTRR